MDEPGGSYTFAHGARKVAPFSIAVFLFGMSGVLAEPSMGRVAPIVMSVTTFAGSAQFAAASILSDAGTLGAAVIAAVLLNARYGPIGVSVAPYSRARARLGCSRPSSSWTRPGRCRPTGAGATTRRSSSGQGLSSTPRGSPERPPACCSAILIGDPTRWGLDAAFPALFLALLVPNLDRPHAKTAAILCRRSGSP